MSRFCKCLKLFIVVNVCVISSALYGVQYIDISAPQVLGQPGAYYRLTNDIILPTPTTESCFTVDANDITLDLNGHTIDGQGNPVNGITILGENALIKNGSIENFGAFGIYFDLAHGSSACDCSLSENSTGIKVNYSDNVILRNITATHNYRGTTSTSSSRGIHLYYSDGVSLYDSVLSENYYGMASDYSDNLIIDNVSSINNANHGFSLRYSKTLFISDCVAQYNKSYGFNLYNYRIESNLIARNLIANNNSKYGFYLSHSTSAYPSNVTITNITAFNNSFSGIYLMYLYNSTISDLNSYNNLQNGLYLIGMDNVSLNNITLSDNLQKNLEISSVSNSTFDNIYLNNSPINLYMGSSDNNFFSNIAMNQANTYDVQLGDSSTNNTFLNAIYDINKEYVYPSSEYPSQLIRQWSYGVRVENPDGSPAGGADLIEISDMDNERLIGQTEPNGYYLGEIVDYINTEGSREKFNLIKAESGGLIGISDYMLDHAELNDKITLDPAPELYVYSGGTGEPNNPYQIANVTDFLQLTEAPIQWNMSFVLTADIDLGGRTFTRAPIAPDTSSNVNSGFHGTQFAGVFDGNGHTITNLTIISAYDYVALFGSVDSAGQIKNIDLKKINITGRNFISGLAAMNSGAISACYAAGSVSGNRYVGGLVALNSGTITDCHATGSIGGNSFIGGLAATNSGAITTCYTTGSVSGTASFIGGLMASNSGTISACYTTSMVSGNSSIGGLVAGNSGTITACYATGSVSGVDFMGGLVFSNSGPISNSFATGSVSGTGYLVGGLVGQQAGSSLTACYATGSVNGTGNVGGLVGYNAGGLLTACYATGSVVGTDGVGGLVGKSGDATIHEVYFVARLFTCYATGLVNGTSNVGGLVGYKSSGTLTGCFWDTATSNTTDGVGNITPDPSGVMGKSTPDMKIRSTFTSAPAFWDFLGETVNGTNDLWFIREGKEYPRLIWEDNKPIADAGEDVSVHCRLDGTASVQLDGSGASDADNDPLIYHWSWTIDQQDYSAEGVTPTIQLPLGSHDISLIVNDGFVDSEPNHLQVIVYNTAPVANVGQDQTAHAWIDGYAQVQLDGTGSLDADGDTLTYSWMLNGQIISTENKPTITLSVGTQTVSLTVSDGLVESAADEVVVTVVATQQGKLMVVPTVISRKGQMPHIMALLQMPEGVDTLDGKMTLYPGGVECTMQRSLRINKRTVVFVWFDKKDVMQTIPANGTIELTIVGKQLDGPYIFGKDRVMIFK